MSLTGESVIGTICMDKFTSKVEGEKLKLLKEIMPEVFTEGKIDFEKLQVALGKDINFESERYVLNWAGKSDAFRTLRQICTKTLVPSREESLNFDETNNIFIEGENLEVLKILRNSYFGKIKMIYIDPPYNTGNDSFIYPDKFSQSLSDYQKRVGDKDENGYMLYDSVLRKNSKENGQYHSNWLNMMMPRLSLARDLLRQDGVIFISIDDNEVHNLRLLCNEIFGEENFVAQITWRKSDNQANIGDIARVKEYILCFTKNKNEFKFNKIPLTDKAKKEYTYKDSLGYFRRDILLHKTRGRYFYNVTTKNNKTLIGPWMIDEHKFKQLDADNKILWTSSGDQQPYGKIYLHESKGQIANDFWDTNYGSNQEASLSLEDLMGERYFDFPKSVILLKTLLNLGCYSKVNDIILDFFAGSGTTAHAVMELNKEDGGSRKYICVQLAEQCDEQSEAYKAGFNTIADICKERIRRVSSKIAKEVTQDNNSIDLGFKVFKVADSNFKQWQQDKISDNLVEQMNLFVDPVIEDATTENMIYEFLLKSGKSLNSRIQQFGCYISVNGNELILLLESINQDIITEIVAKNPQKVIALDRLFSGNDQLKTNTYLQMKDANIEFETL